MIFLFDFRFDFVNHKFGLLCWFDLLINFDKFLSMIMLLFMTLLFIWYQYVYVICYIVYISFFLKLCNVCSNKILKLILVSLYFNMTMHVTFVCYRVIRDYYFTISRERSSVEILTRSSIFPEFQTKVDIKVTASR